jgi:hypothetical protein
VFDPDFCWKNKLANRSFEIRTSEYFYGSIPKESLHFWYPLVIKHGLPDNPPLSSMIFPAHLHLPFGDFPSYFPARLPPFFTARHGNLPILNAQ